jgi:hypothetical protein
LVNGQIGVNQADKLLFYPDALGAVKSLSLNIFNYKNITSSTTLTGTLSETQLLQVTIPANTFGSSDILKIPELTFVNGGSTSGITFKIKLSTSNTMPSGTTGQIATFQALSTSLVTKMNRVFTIKSGTIQGVSFTTSLANDNGNQTVTISSQAFDPTVVNYLYITATLAVSTNTTYLNSIQITNI